MTISATRLREAEALLELVEAGLKQVTEGPDERRVPGVRNVLLFGNAFATAMKAIASKDRLFASWLDVQKPVDGIEELGRIMMAEPKTRRDYTQVQLASAGKAFGPRPANARAFFSGDRLGGSGWEIDLPGGRVEKYYVQLPDELPAGYSFTGTDRNAETLARRRVAQLREMLRHARIAVQ
ncbi:MAG: hypothetical protein M3P06_07185 [Acidobacteriota bacterium]|nr:hypothetical protein [Acidobacteriota bacterium]